MYNKIKLTAVALTLSLAATLTCSDEGGSGDIEVSVSVSEASRITHNYAYVTVQYAASGATVTEVGAMYSTSLGRLHVGAFDTHTEANNSPEFGIVSGIPTVTGTFGADLAGLWQDTEYYVIPYIKLDKSSGDFYKGYFLPTGGHKSFKTNPDYGSSDYPAEVSGTERSNLTYTTVTLSATVTSAGNPGFTERGFCYGTAPNPAKNESGTCVQAPGFNIEFSQPVTGLTENTTYYVRAYIINSSFGTRYGAENSFKTPREAVAGAKFKFTDARDGQEYWAVDIDGMVWMAENLNFTTDRSWCYENDRLSCERYGRLYHWNAAMEACPAGWHLPSRVEWADLIAAVGGEDVAGGKLKSDTGWENEWCTGTDCNGTDDFGFSGLPGGQRIDGSSFNNAGSSGLWWNATMDVSYDHGTTIYVYGRSMNTGDYRITENSHPQNHGLSVRCVRDDPAKKYTLTVNFAEGGTAVTRSPNKASYNNGEQVTITTAIGQDGYFFEEWTGGQTANPYYATTTVIMTSDMTITANFQKKGSFTDSRDGQSYGTIKIVNQTWMTENLNYDASGSACYDNNCNTYGRLYDWATAMGISSEYNDSQWDGNDVNHQGVCPSGWHIPSDDEWRALTNSVGGESTAGTKLKSKSGWIDDRNGTDDYGFSALPGGGRWGDGGFHGAGGSGHWWSATEGGASGAWNRTMNIYINNGDVGRNDYYKAYLFSLRCVRDD